MPPTQRASSRPDSESRLYPPPLFVAIGVAVIVHLNYWLWDADTLVMGLPVNLFYHVALTLALALFMSALVRRYWPAFLDEEDGE